MELLWGRVLQCHPCRSAPPPPPRAPQAPGSPLTAPLVSFSNFHAVPGQPRTSLPAPCGRPPTPVMLRAAPSVPGSYLFGSLLFAQTSHVRFCLFVCFFKKNEKKKSQRKKRETCQEQTHRGNAMGGGERRAPGSAWGSLLCLQAPGRPPPPALSAPSHILAGACKGQACTRQADVAVLQHPELRCPFPGQLSPGWPGPKEEPCQGRREEGAPLASRSTQPP